MAWSPPFGPRNRPDPRLDPYRDRVANLKREGSLAFQVYVGTSFLSQHLGGYLWWRWAEPFEFVTMDIFRAGVYVEDAWVTDENLDRDLKEWDQGTFTYRGVQFELAWMNSEDSDHFRRAHDL